MRWTTSFGGWFLVASALALALPAHGLELEDGHATDGALVARGAAEFRGDLLAYAQGQALLLLDEEGDAPGWGVEGEDVTVLPLGLLPRLEAGARVEAELVVNVTATAWLGLPAHRTTVQREAEVRAVVDGPGAAALLFGAFEDEAPEERDAPTLRDGRLVAVYVMDGLLHLEGRDGSGLVLHEPLALPAIAGAQTFGFPTAVNPGAYALTMPSATWTARGSVLALVETDEGLHAVRVREGSLFGTEARQAKAYAGLFQGAFDGTLVLSDATGHLDVGPDTHTLLGNLVRLTGTYAFAAQRADPDAADGRAKYTLTGSTVAIVVPTESGVELPPVVFLLPAALVALGALVYFAEIVKFAAFAPAMGLFSRIADSQLLANEVRDRIHRLVSENPGITIKECMALAGVGWGTTVYHLRRLEDSRMVTSIRDGNFRRFYRNGAAPGTAQKAVLGEMRREPSVRIAQFVMANPGACQKDLCEALEMSPPLAHKYMRRLLNANLVTSQREWKKVKYYPTESLQKAANGWGDGGVGFAGAARALATSPAGSGIGAAAQSPAETA